MVDTQGLLTEYRPVVQYDSLDPYYTDSAAIITDHPGNVLKRLDGTIVAAAPGTPGIDEPALSLDFLRADTYPGGETVIDTDYIDENDTDYQGSAREMHARDGYGDKVHGRLVQQNGVIWLQYWFFMYYDDPGFFHIGSHEGDIEMIQIRLDPGENPVEVSYAQHRSGVRALWSDVEQQDGAPVVYSARGTHASMLRSGSLRSGRSFLTDHNDAGGPRPRLDLIPLSLDATPWAFWPGHWGGTRAPDPVLGELGVEANSPAALSQHGAWKDPALFHSQCDPDKLPAIGAPHTIETSPPPQPQLVLEPQPDRGVVRVKYTIPADARAPWPTGLVIGVGATGDHGPPSTITVPHPHGSGELELPMPSGASQIEAHATTHSDQGAVSETARVQAPVGGAPGAGDEPGAGPAGGASGDR